MFIRMVTKELGSIRGKRVLELGAGGPNYRLLAMAKWAGAEVIANDYSEEGLRLLREVFRRESMPLQTIVGDCVNLQLTERVDFVVHWGLLEHFSDPAPIILAGARQLVEGGCTLWSMPNMEAHAARFWRRWSPDNYARHIHHELGTLDNACAIAGMRLEHEFFFGYPFLQIATWETRGPLQWALTAAAQATKQMTWLLRTGTWGNRRVSMERGLRARRTA